MPPDVRDQLSLIAARCWEAARSDCVLHVTPSEFMLLREWADRADEWDVILMEEYRKVLPQYFSEWDAKCPGGVVGVYSGLNVVVDEWQ